MWTVGKELVYTDSITISNLFIALRREDFTIYGYIYKECHKRLFRKPKIKYFYIVDIPYIIEPYYDGEYNTNRILQVKGKILENQLKLKIFKLENEC